MSVEAFVWFYKDQECASIEIDEVFEAFGNLGASWMPESGLLRLDFRSPEDTCELYVQRGDANENEVRGLMISRPVQDVRLWSAVLALMDAHRGMLFFSDETTPYFHDVGDSAHYPVDLLHELGTLTEVRSPEALLALRSRL